LNEETNICLHDRPLVDRLTDIFFMDLELCRRIELREWRGRGLVQRGQEAFASLIEDQL
jgi:hypothetical protein